MMKHILTGLVFLLFEVDLFSQFENLSSNTGIIVGSNVDWFGNGMSAFDFNQDGFEDMTVANNDSGVALYTGNGDGTFTLIQFIYAPYDIKQVLWIDFDRDQDPDLFFTSNGNGIFLYENSGDLVLIWCEECFDDYSQMYAYGASWADYDKDGWLDVFVCAYDYENVSLFPNLLFKFDGEEFIEVGASMGVNSFLDNAFQSVWVDFDFDSWPDLYVINDHSVGNEFYHNVNGEYFENWSDLNGSNVALSSMCNAICDYDHDSDFDIFVSNGGPQFLLRNDNGQFINVASSVGVEVLSNAWGGLWLDYNNDGWDDLHLCTEMSATEGNLNPFFVNEGGSYFTIQNFDDSDVNSYVNVKADFDNDLMMDFAVYNGAPASISYYHNKVQHYHAVGVKLIGSASDYFGIGAVVEMFIEDNVQLSQIHAGENYMSQNGQKLILGCNDYSNIDSLFIHWPMGWTDKWYNLAVDETYIFVEGETYMDIPEIIEVEICEDSEVTLYNPNENFGLWNTGVYDNQLSVENPGEYTQWITNANGNVHAVIFNVSNYIPPLIETDISDVTCYGYSDGKIEVVEGFEFTSNIFWSNGDVEFSADSLSSGSHSCQIIFENGCSMNLFFEIDQPAEFAMEYTPHEICQNETANVILNSIGGNPPYLVDWFDQNPLEISAGIYPVQIEDSLGCVYQEEINILQVDKPIIEFDSLLACFGETIEFVNTTPFDLQLTSGNEIPAELFAGIYDVTVHYSDQCALDTTLVVFENGQMHVDYGIINEGNGFLSIELEISGGTSPYLVSWENGETGLFLNNVSPSNYNVTVEDAQGCVHLEQVQAQIQNMKDVSHLVYVYPNPAQDFITVVGIATDHWIICDLQGRESQVVPDSIFNNKINIEGLDNGQYLLKFENYVVPFVKIQP